MLSSFLQCTLGAVKQLYLLAIIYYLLLSIDFRLALSFNYVEIFIKCG